MEQRRDDSDESIPDKASLGEALSAQGGQRTRILVAATRLLASQGQDALTTRAVAAAAGVQAPALYRLFGDKRSLLDAVAEYGFLSYLNEKQLRVPGPDPLENLRAGWDLHVDFGLSNPALFAVMSGNRRSGVQSPAAAAGLEHLGRRIRDLAVAGRLRVSEQRAADLMRAAGLGTVLTLLEMPADRRDLGLSALAREAVIAAIVTDPLPVQASGMAGAAVALRATLPDDGVLTPGERSLLNEWLERLAQGPL
ncbi:TetR/AcrR family transcriptional regulator [Deinococcus sp.]|uniref:TetR/AcrR family transcriptional regulator n=1 Tax=Deinococcus sp. TaxID=47478 RepID=UPI003CC6309C